jgi:hypothetical protein
MAVLRLACSETLARATNGNTYTDGTPVHGGLVPVPASRKSPPSYLPARSAIMTTLVINDLPESIELDRQAMAAITGGAMVRGHGAPFARRRTLTGLDSPGAQAVASLSPTPATSVQTLLFAEPKTLVR